MTDEPQYLIWSNEHRAWWRAGSAGYCRGLARAGIYSRSEALAICRKAIPGAASLGMLTEIPVSMADIAALLDGPGGLHKSIWDEPS